MAHNFPDASPDGTITKPLIGPAWKSSVSSTLWRRAGPAGSALRTALPFNYVVNPCMDISQQNADVLGSANGYFPADQWGTYVNAVSTLNSGRVKQPTPWGSDNQITLVFATSAALAAGEYMAIMQRIEGNRIADLKWGTAEAKDVVIRFGAKVNIEPAGGSANCCLTLRGPSPYRTISAPFTATNGGDYHTVVIPGPTSGAFPVDNTTGLEVWFVFVTGSTHAVNTPYTWLTGGTIGVPGMTNATSIGNSLNIYDVGMYADPDKTGVPPPFETPKYEDVLRECQRYWFKGYSQRGYTSSTTIHSHAAQLNPYPMRIINPAVAFVGTINCYDATTTVAASAVQTNRSSMNYFYNAFTTAAVVATRPGGHILGGTGYVAVSARM